MSTYDLYKNKTYSLRLPNELRKKVEWIANENDRKMSQQFELIIRNFVNDYEAIHGEIKVEEKS